MLHDMSLNIDGNKDWEAPIFEDKDEEILLVGDRRGKEVLPSEHLAVDSPPATATSSQEIEMKSFWIAAEHALQHIQKNQSQIDAAFYAHHIGKSEYVLYAGFDESLIRAEIGYLEQIHIFSSASIIDTSPLLSQLGRILSPFSSILFTESSVYELPVYKPNGTTWIFDELVFCTASKLIDRGSTATMYPTVISLSKASGESNPSGGEPPKEYGSDDKRGASNMGKGKEEGPDDSIGKPSTKSPTLLFDVTSEISATQNGVEKLFQLLTVQGEIMIQTDHHRSHSHCNVKFLRLNFGNQRETVDNGYEQFHLRVTIDPRERDANAEAIQPRQTSASDYRITSRTKKTGSGTTEKRKYTFQIVEQVLYGVVRWGFKINDKSDAKEGTNIKIPGSKLPQASFELRAKFESIDSTSISVPSYVDVEITSYWSLVSLDKISSMLSRAQKNGVVYFNICQAVVLKIPLNLTKRSNCKAAHRVNIADPGLNFDTILRDKDGHIDEISGTDRYSPAEHEYETFLALPTLERLTLIKARRL